jgi:hypothetical protein
VPVRNWRFGARVPNTALEEIQGQLYLMHKYRNELCRIELDRRAACQEIVTKASPRMQQLEGEITTLAKELSDLETEVRAHNKQTRSRSAPVELRSRTSQTRANLKTLRTEYRNVKKATYGDPLVKARLAQVSQDDNARIKEARGKSRLYWCNYLTVETDCESFRKGPPPRFKRFERDGRVALQLQNGLSIEKATSGESTLLHLYKAGDNNPKHWVCRMRVGGEGRKGIFAEVPFLMHRELPKEAKIKWLYLQRSRVATHDEWHLMFSLEAAEWPRKQAKRGTVGVDLGWRLLKNSDLRVAYWHGSDGKSGQLVIPKEDLSRWHRADTLRSTRDSSFNQIKEHFLDWLGGEMPRPEWLTEQTEHLCQWRSQARLAAVVIYWRNHRFDGDENIYEALEKWRKQDKHLFDWQEYQRKRSINWRNNLYRCFAKTLAEKYRTCVMENTNWRDMAELPEVESSEVTYAVPSYNRAVSAIGKLSLYLKEAMKEVQLVDPANSTHECADCGTIDDFDAVKELEHVCSNCLSSWDQDHNAARVLLCRGQEAKA